jgi:hypothetical protein
MEPSAPSSHDPAGPMVSTGFPSKGLNPSVDPGSFRFSRMDESNAGLGSNWLHVVNSGACYTRLKLSNLECFKAVSKG